MKLLQAKDKKVGLLAQLHAAAAGFVRGSGLSHSGAMAAASQGSLGERRDSGCSALHGSWMVVAHRACSAGPAPPACTTELKINIVSYLTLLTGHDPGHGGSQRD